MDGIWLMMLDLRSFVWAYDDFFLPRTASISRSGWHFYWEYYRSPTFSRIYSRYHRLYTGIVNIYKQQIPSRPSTLTAGN